MRLGWGREQLSCDEIGKAPIPRSSAREELAGLLEAERRDDASHPADAFRWF